MCPSISARQTGDYQCSAVGCSNTQKIDGQASLITDSPLTSSTTYLRRKNPAYGRHRIFRPMRIDTPIQKRNIYVFFLLQGIWFGGGIAVHSAAEHWSTFYPSNYTTLLSRAVHFTAKLKHIYIYIDLMQRNLIPWTALNFGVQQIADWQCTAMYCTALLPLLCTTLNCTG